MPERRLFTKGELHTFLKLFNVSEALVNSGDCYNFAYYLYLKHPGKFELCSTHSNGGHAFLKHKELFIDSETPCGVKDWRDLQSIWDKKTHKDNFEIETERAFKKTWDNLNVRKIKRNLRQELGVALVV